MTISLRSFGLTAVCLMWAITASAQTSSTTEETRPATTTFDGDTGLWYVPTAETLARGAFAASAYRAGMNYVYGFSNVADIAGTFSYGIFRGAELFGSFKVDTRIDRDLRPLFNSNTKVGGVNPRYPLDTKGWSGDNVGDLIIGVKLNFLSEANQKPVAVAFRPSFKIPTGDKDAGVSTGKVDSYLDFVVSKDAGKIVEVSGYAGAALRSSTDEVSQSNGLRYGFGIGYPSHFPLRFTGEINGEKPFDDTVS